jgi:LacI family transcriptional regulator
MKRIAILVETALASGRSILSGISRYLQEHEDWSVFHPTGYMGSTDVTGLQDWEGDGILARISSPEVLEQVRAKGVPVVDVLGNVPQSRFPLVKCDDGAIGDLVAGHLIAGGHRHFAYLGLGDERWSQEREASFREAVARHAESFHRMQIERGDRMAGHWKGDLDQLASWLGALPQPLGLMIASDQLGPVVMKACQQTARLVPEEISVVGVDNDLPFCELCRPRLSSVEPDHARAGYEAARLLDQMITGGAGSTRLVETPPLTLHARASSDATAVEDPALVKALQCIRERACGGLSVDEVARAAGLSRSVLQRRFRQQLNRTVGDAMLSVRLRRARDLLAFTILPLIDVAERSGFTYQEYLSYAFRKHLRTTPARYRAEQRGDPARTAR